MNEIEVMRQEKLQNQQKISNLRDQLDQAVCSLFINWTAFKNLLQRFLWSRAVDTCHLFSRILLGSRDYTKRAPRPLNAMK